MAWIKYKKIKHEQEKNLFLKNTFLGWYLINGKYIAVILHILIVVYFKLIK
jgi:hypothetical protein